MKDCTNLHLTFLLGQYVMCMDNTYFIECYFQQTCENMNVLNDKLSYRLHSQFKYETNGTLQCKNIEIIIQEQAISRHILTESNLT